MVKFAKFTVEERELIKRMFARVKASNPKTTELSYMNFEMDLAAVHASNPLKLKELAEADDFNFFHDMNGIGEHLNRETGQLEEFFSPRYSLR